MILSTSKPQLKNVTDEDVNHALYYVHLELATSDLAAPGPIRDDYGNGSDGSASPITIPRKPLPDTASLEQTESQLGAVRNFSGPDPLPAVETDDKRTSQALPVLAPLVTDPTDGASHPRTPAGLHTGMPARKPLGPRPMVSAEAAAAVASSPLEPVPVSNHFTQRDSLEAPRDNRPGSSGRSPSPRKRSITTVHGGTPFTLTLIRKDPSTQSQWNVGKVSSRQLEAEEILDHDGPLSVTMPTPSSPPTHPPISIDLETSGYAKFRAMPKRNSGGELAATLNSLGRSPDSAKPPIGVFSRQLAMAYSKSFATNLREKIQHLDQVRRSKMGRNRSDSAASMDSVNSDPGIDSVVTTGAPPPGMKARGYTFASPWDGRCEFSTGHSGRSMQCRHVKHDGEAAVYGDGHKPSPDAVSELRFNLPSSELFAEQAKEQWRGNFSKLLRPHEDHDDYDDDDAAVSPFDINVGSEKAGGGIRGRRAKLGKLIVFGEGLKMLDLVVAANMGIWWGAWEKNF